MSCPAAGACGIGKGSARNNGRIRFQVARRHPDERRSRQQLRPAEIPRHLPVPRRFEGAEKRRRHELCRHIRHAPGHSRHVADLYVSPGSQRAWLSRDDRLHPRHRLARPARRDRAEEIRTVAVYGARRLSAAHHDQLRRPRRDDRQHRQRVRVRAGNGERTGLGARLPAGDGDLLGHPRLHGKQRPAGILPGPAAHAYIGGDIVAVVFRVSTASSRTCSVRIGGMQL